MPSPAPDVSPPCPPRSWPIVAGVMLVVAGVRGVLLAAFGSDVPYLDEWPAIAAGLFQPWVEGHLDWSALFAPHSEHRIVLTRLWELGFFLGNSRRWDPWLVATANTLLFALTAGLFVAFATTYLSRRNRLWVLAGSLCVLLVPFGYSNLLFAFQSQFVFYTLLAIAALGLWRKPEITFGRLLGAILCAALGLFTLGSGPLIGLTLALIAATRIRRQSPDRRRWPAGLIAASACVVAGILLAARRDPFPAAGEMIHAAGRYLAWPAGNLLSLVTDWPDSARYLPAVAGTWPSPASPWIPALAGFFARHQYLETALYWLLGLALHGPGLRLAARIVSGKAGETSWFIPALTIWVLLNIAAMAIARSEHSIVPPRYQDILALGLLANGLAWIELRQRGRNGSDPALTGRATRANLLCASWLALAGLCVAITAGGILLVQLPRKRTESQAATRLIQAYLISGDAEIFLHQPPNHVPWPQEELALAGLLRDPAVREFLPRGLIPEPIRPEPPLLSRAARRVRESGWVLAALGALALLAGAFLPRKR